MLNKIQNKLDSAQIVAGYSVTGTLASTPVWLDSLTAWFELVAVILAVLVGVTTVWLNIQKINK